MANARIQGAINQVGDDSVKRALQFLYDNGLVLTLDDIDDDTVVNQENFDGADQLLTTSGDDTLAVAGRLPVVIGGTTYYLPLFLAADFTPDA
jgi:hypothetical protein